MLYYFTADPCSSNPSNASQTCSPDPGSDRGYICYIILQLIHVPLILAMLARLAHQILVQTEAIYVNVHQDMQEIVMNVKVCKG